MKTMMKYRIMKLMGVLVLMTSCYQDELPLPPTEEVPAGYKAIEFMAQVPQMEIVNTRAVDPDGGGVQQITVFCFDENSLFITTVTADLTTDGAVPSLNGQFRVIVPDHTATMHLVGNQNLTYFREDNYRGMSEVDVMAALEASAGRMIYWARETMETLPTHDTREKAVKLLRNQAKITLKVDNTKTNFVESGWVVVGSNAFGTVAPYNAKLGGFVRPTVDNPFVTLPDNRARLGDYLDVLDNEVEYIFETENSEASPIDFIIKGHHNGGQELYYRISLIDEKGNYVPIMRNHHYTVNIAGSLNYGQASFEEALTAPATNNVWVSVSDNIAEVQDSEYRLAVEKTSVVIVEDEFKTPNTYYLHYTLESLRGGQPTEAEVTWMEGNDVALHNFTHTFDAATGRGTILITLNDMNGKQKREGTLSVKKGRLSRKIKVVTVKRQTFEPAWITTNIYGVGTGENVTMMFTIPEECPRELLPIDVLISVDALDIRNESGMSLPVIRSGDEGYGADNGIGYKYVLTVTETGKQSVYLETILEQKTGNAVEVTIESECFKQLTKTATFQSEVNQWILLHNLRTYSTVQPADEVIYYYLVPQKVNAVVDFPTHLGKDIVWNPDHTVKSYTAIEAGNEDEFLIYSKYLDHNEERTDLDFTFYPVSSDTWSTGGRVYGFTKNPSSDFGAVFHMITNTPKSAETVRIASNPAGQPSVTGNGLCSGAQYRSAIFELANFHPFHFAAQVNGQGTIISGENEEVTDYVVLNYQPGQRVEIAFDITSFTSTIHGTNGNILPTNEQKSVDPFGTAFDIYIDAPMLAIDETSTLFTNGKLERDPNKEGRFIYHVDANREIERSSGSAVARLTDALATSQTGERKVLSFKTKNIVTTGEITISADASKVSYYTKTFKIQNQSITGTLQYRKEGHTVEPIPAGAFVPFEVEPTYNRIGAVSITEGGKFELRLRSEYRYDWNTDNVKLQFTDTNGTKYEKVFDSIAALYASLNNPIILEPQQ